MKSIILSLALVALVFCQLVVSSVIVSENSLAGDRIVGSLFVEQSSKVVESSPITSAMLIQSSESSSPFSVRSLKACACTGCQTFNDLNLQLYHYNTTCTSGNFAGNTFNIGSDNTQEIYKIYNFKDAEYAKFVAGQLANYMTSYTTNCLSSTSATAYNSQNVIAAYYCDSQVANATTCTTKSSYSGVCFIGLAAVKSNSSFVDGKLKVQVDMYGTDGNFFARSASNVKVTVKGGSYSETFTSQNLFKGSMIFTITLPTSASAVESFTINVEVENYYGSLSAQEITQNRSVNKATSKTNDSSQHFTFSGIVLMLCLIIFTLF